jgi:hypothetical protein
MQAVENCLDGFVTRRQVAAYQRPLVTPACQVRAMITVRLREPETRST